MASSSTAKPLAWGFARLVGFRWRNPDFPNKKPQTPEVKKQNEALKKKYDVGGFPTFVLVDADGKELGRQVGYLKGGPSAFVSKIETWKKAPAK
jgi:hypothetical protein